MFKRIDGSKFLIQMLERLSDWLAARRGVPIIGGLVLFVIGSVLQLINVAVDSTMIEVVHILLQNLGVIAALVGILLLQPLGD